MDMAQFHTKLWNEANQKILGLEAVVKQYQEKAIIISNAAVARIKIMEPKLEEVHEFVLAAKKPVRGPAFADVEVQENPSAQKKLVSSATDTSKTAANPKQAPTSAVAKSVSSATVTKIAAKPKKAAKSVAIAAVTKPAATRKKAPSSPVVAKAIQSVAPIGESEEAAEGPNTTCASKDQGLSGEQMSIANQNANHYQSGFPGDSTEDEDDDGLTLIITDSKNHDDDEE